MVFDFCVIEHLKIGSNSLYRWCTTHPVMEFESQSSINMVSFLFTHNFISDAMR